MEQFWIGDAEVLQSAHLTLRPRWRTVEEEGAPIDVKLSLKEVAFLYVFMQHEGEVLTRDELMDGVYGVATVDVHMRTVDTYVARLRNKLYRDYIQTVRGVGYAFSDVHQS